MAKKQFKLTPAHDKFCVTYANTGNATASYLAAFPNVTYGSARELGSNLLTNVDIQDKISILKEEYKVKFDLDRERTERDLITAAEEAKSAGQFSAYAKLRDMVIKIRGFYAPDKVEHSGNLPITVIKTIEVKKDE